MRTYKVQTQPYNQNGYVESDCNAIQFLNRGSASVTINKAIVLAQGEEISFSGLEDEKDITNYQIKFDSSGDKNLIVNRKKYVR